MTNEQKTLMILNTNLQINAAILAILAANNGVSHKVKNHLSEASKIDKLISEDILSQINGKA